MKSRINHILCACAAAVLFAGCFKSVSYDTTCIIRPYTQAAGAGDAVSLPGAVAHAFAVDSSAWRVASYEDAVAGVLTAWHDPSQKITLPAATAVPYAANDTIPASANWLQMQLEGPSMMIVVADTEHRLYAYRQQFFSENFSPFYLSVNFRPRVDKPVLADGGWVYINDFYTPELILKPTVQLRESHGKTPLLDVELYAYAVDTTQWRVASYADAMNRTITSISDPAVKRSTPDYEGSPDPDGKDEGWMRIEQIRTERLMVVAVFAGNRIYAYSMQEFPTNGKFLVEELTFRLWKEEYIEEKWHVINEAFDPEAEEPVNPGYPDEPETPEEPENPEE